MKALSLAVLIAAAAIPAAQAEQKGSSGQPLSVYCNTVPDLSVQRTDQVDNWVRLCMVWLNAQCGKTDRAARDSSPPPSKKKN